MVPKTPSTSTLLLGKLEVQVAQQPDARKDRHGAVDYNNGLPEGRGQRVVVRDNQLTVSELIDKVVRLDDQGCPPDGVEEGLVDDDVGRDDG